LATGVQHGGLPLRRVQGKEAMTDSPFLDPNDPHYSDTPSVDEYPLEGGADDGQGLTRRQLRMAVENILDRPGADPDDDAAILARFADRYLDGPAIALDPADGYLLVSEAELAEALLAHHGWWAAYHDSEANAKRFARDVFAALAKQQEARER
jgi:hypothetical protein